MTVEFFGLPATGKTTCANALEERPDFSRPAVKRFMVPAFRFWIRYPWHTILLLWIILTHSKLEDIYTKCVHGLGVRLARHTISVSEHRIVDEGVVQNILTLSDTELSPRMLHRLLCSMPRTSDVYVVLATPEDIRRAYAEKRGRVFARTKSKEEDERLLAVASSHAAAAISFLKERGCVVHQGSCETIPL